MDFILISVALGLGLIAYRFDMPPLLGFLATGFLFRAFELDPGPSIGLLSELGITLLLFTIGLKLQVRKLLRPQVWAVASIHMLIVVAVFSLCFYGLALLQLGPFAELEPVTAILLAFALSFSSTVFAVKVLEAKGELAAIHGQIALGILIVQDLFAVIFIAFTTGKIPTVIGVAIVAALIIFRRWLIRLMEYCGHGELLMLFGVFLALGGAQIFEAFGIKGDLGALFLGALLAGHPQAKEMEKHLYDFRNLFLIGFFVSIGLIATPTLSAIAVALVFALLMPLKAALFFGLLTRFKLTARSSLFTTFSLANYSEFGLIVGASALASGWIAGDWVVIIALSLVLTFLVATPLNHNSSTLFDRWFVRLSRFELAERVPEESPHAIGNARALVFGMGRVGTPAYEWLNERFKGRVVGIEVDPDLVARHQAEGRRVILGNAADPFLWERARESGEVEFALLTMNNYRSNLSALAERDRLIADAAGRTITVGAAARFPDEAEALRQGGAELVLDFYGDAGIGLAEKLLESHQA